MRDKDYRLYVHDILEAITSIQEYMGDLTFEQFTKDKKTIDAIIRNFAIIGEAAKNIPDSVKREHPEIEWKRMTGMRDKLIHEYHGISLKVVWDTTKTDLTTSKPLLEQLLNN